MGVLSYCVSEGVLQTGNPGTRRVQSVSSAAQDKTIIASSGGPMSERQSLLKQDTWRAGKKSPENIGHYSLEADQSVTASHRDCWPRNEHSPRPMATKAPTAFAGMFRY